MNPVIIIAAIEGALTLIEKLSPLVRQLFQQGEITIEQQAEMTDRIKRLSQQQLFDGPEWKVE